MRKVCGCADGFSGLFADTPTGLKGISQLAESLEEDAKLQVVDTVIEVLTQVLPEPKTAQTDTAQADEVCGSLLASHFAVKKPELVSSIAAALEDEKSMQE